MKILVGYALSLVEFNIPRYAQMSNNMNQNQRTVIEMVSNIASFIGTQRQFITQKW